MIQQHWDERIQDEGPFAAIMRITGEPLESDIADLYEDGKEWHVRIIFDNDDLNYMLRHWYIKPQDRRAFAELDGRFAWGGLVMFARMVMKLETEYMSQRTDWPKGHD